VVAELPREVVVVVQESGLRLPSEASNKNKKIAYLSSLHKEKIREAIYGSSVKRGVTVLPLFREHESVSPGNVVASPPNVRGPYFEAR